MKPRLCPLLGWEEDENPYSYDCTGCTHYDEYCDACRMKEKGFAEKAE